MLESIRSQESMEQDTFKLHARQYREIAKAKNGLESPMYASTVRNKINLGIMEETLGPSPTAQATTGRFKF